MENLGSQINEVIDNIASKLGTTSAYLIPEYAKVEVARCIIGCLFSFIILIFGIYGVKKSIKVFNSNEYYDEFCWYTVFIVSGITLFIGASIMFFYLSATIGWIASPTGQTMHMIMEALK